MPSHVGSTLVGERFGGTRLIPALYVASAVLLKAANGLAIARIKANWSSETGVSTIGKFLVIWDGLKCHRSRLVWDFVRQQQGRIWLEFLPAYAPEVNPVEYLWGTRNTMNYPTSVPRTLAN